jgi:hypothetical protein
MHPLPPAALLLSLLAGSAFGDEPWRLLRREPDGLTLEARAVAGTAFEEYRVRGHAAAAPGELADLAWTWRPDGVEGRLVQRRVVLSDRPSERVVYQVVNPPVVSRRQSLVRFHREDSDQGKTIHISFATVDGPLPEQVDAVRVALIRGDWSFQADPAGGTWVEHRIVSDPGGGLPPWLAAGTQQDIAVKLVREVVERARPIVGSSR